MNRENESIQFTYEKSQSEIVFLDVIVYEVKKSTKTTPEDGTHTLNVRTHIKPMKKQLYVRMASHQFQS